MAARSDHWFADAASAGCTTEVSLWADQARSEMDTAGVPPTPQNFELWYTHVSGANPALSQQITFLLGAPVTTAALAELQTRFPHPDTDADHLADQADELQIAARTMVDDVASGGEQLRQYGTALSRWTAALADHRTLDTLVQAVAALTAETISAAERNRTLEKLLSTSSSRIARLRDSLTEVKRGASIDALTGLFNRKTFNIRLRRALSGAKAGGAPVSALLLDIDRFKTVNDSHGHQAGDLVLRLLGRLLAENVKGRDTAARYGGDEFAVLLIGTELRAATIVGNQIREALEGKRLISRRQVEQAGTVTVSIGVAQLQPGDTSASLLERADVALYRAKSQGRNIVCAA